MKKQNILKYVMIGASSAIIGYSASQLVHTQRRAWTADINRDVIEDVVIEAKDGRRAVIYGKSNHDSSFKEFISGEELSDILNKRWKKEYEDMYGKKPGYDKFNLKTKWEYW